MSLTRRRTATDVTMALTLTSDGVRIDFADLSNITVMIYSDRYRVAAGRCSYEIAGTTLLVKSPADNQRYLGDHRVVLTCTYGASKATYDAPAFEVVATSAEVDQQGQTSAQETGAIGIDLHVEDISSSLVQEVIAAAINATTEALEAAEEARNAQGPQGEQGPVGPVGPQGEQGPVGPSYDDTEIKNKLTELSEEKEDKTNKVTALSDESTDVQYPSAKCVHDSLSSLAEEIASNGVLIEDLQNMKIDKENDDYYPNMAVGLADNLAGVDVVDSEINFRRSGGGAISDGVARIESIKGNSVVWNQLKKSVLATSTINGVTFTPQANGGILVNGTATSNAYYAITNNNVYVADHKLFLIGSKNNIGIMFGGNMSDNKINEDYIFSKAESFDNQCFLYVKSGSVIENVTIYPIITDLTKAFQAGNEPTTIEEFYARIPMGVDLNAYNEGEVIHMDVQSIESVGENQWDEEWEVGSISSTTGENTEKTGFIRSINRITLGIGATYHNSSPYKLYLRFYDSAQQFITYSEAQPNQYVPKNEAAKYLLFSVELSEYKNDICINLGATGVNGKYFPYIKRVEDLSIIRKYFPQGMKSAGSAHDEIRYNKASGKWEKVVRIGEVDMGTLNWTKASSGSVFYTTINDLKWVAESKLGLSGNYSKMLCSKYVSIGSQSLSSASEIDKSLSSNSIQEKRVQISDTSYTDAATFKAAMSGVMLYYELAEPIVFELDEADQFKDLDYQVWNYGTEKANAEGKSAPLAADITYGFNAIGKIKELEKAIKALQTTVASL